jgi:SAM-dependent methyltransferase
MAVSERDLPPGAGIHLKVFRQSLPLQVMLHEVLKSLGPTAGQDCLEIGADNGMVSYYLRKQGGDWTTVVTGQKAVEAVRAVCGGEVHVIKDAALPFRKKVFDTVIIFDYLARIQMDSAFVEECHRTLKPDGRLIVHTPRIQAWTAMRGIRRMLGVSSEVLGQARLGYTETMLFNLLKDGFDVHNMHAYSRFFVELVTALKAAALRRAEGADTGDQERRAARIGAVAGVLYRLAFQLDMLLFMTKGHRLVAVAKRRGWRSRATPVLVDGRSITEAVLSRAAD